MYETVYWPDYKNCTANLPNSILKYFGAETVGDTLPVLDKYLDKEYKNVVVLLLDGMGSSVVGWSKGFDGQLYKHEVASYDSVFPSSTVPSTCSVMSGLQPCEHAWLGWDNYYKDIDKNVTVFLNTLQGTDKSAEEYNVARQLTPFRPVTDRLEDAGVRAYMVSPFEGIIVNSFSEFFSRIKELCAENERKYIYAYWPSPDDLLHEHGGACSKVDEVASFIADAEARIVDLTRAMEDTLLIVTADHGHTDVSVSKLEDYPQITDCLERTPSMEPRAVNFFVKKGRKRDFVREFKKVYGDKFILLTKKEVLERKLFGTGQEHEKFRDMLGDYLAVATSDQSIMFTEDAPWVSMHGGATQREIKVPLIIFHDFFFLGQDVEAYVDEAVRRLKRDYFWADKSMLRSDYSYKIEETDGKKEFVQYYTYQNGEIGRSAEGWDGDLFVQRIMYDNRSSIENANTIKEVFDVRPDYGVDCHGWCLERFEFRSHVLGGYSAFVQAGDRVAGGSREFYFTQEQMSGTFEDFLQSNDELLSGAFGLDRDYMRSFKGLKEFLGFNK